MGLLLVPSRQLGLRVRLSRLPAMSEYARVYHSIVDDEKFREVYDNDAALATWLRLLIIADQAWPASASIPASAKRRTVDLLVRVGLLDTQPGWRYRIHGLDSERNERSDTGKRAAAKRWHSEGNAGASVIPMPSKAEQSRAKQSSDDGRADLDAYLSVRYRVPTPAQRQLMDAYVQVFDVTGPARAARLILANPDDPIGALKGDLAAFRAQRADEARKSEPPKPEPRRPTRGMTGVNAEIQKVLAAQYAADERKHRHSLGEHAERRDNECPLCMEAVA